MNKSLWLVLQIALLVCIVQLLAPFCLRQTDGFAVCRLQSAFPNDPRWDGPPLSSEEQTEFERAINQHYTYLGSGGQCFAFVSEDDRYVIKFFKHRLRKPQAWLMGLALPEPLRSRCSKFRDRILSKHQRDFTSYRLAYDTLKTETGLLCVHLNKSSHIHKQLIISDKLHINHAIDLDQTEFVLQKKAQLVYPTIAKMMEQGDLQSAQQALHSILSILVSRCQKGVFDEDPRLHCNIGLIGTDAIFIDVGRFKPDPQRKDPEIYHRDLALITERFRSWLSDNYPALLPTFEEEMRTLDPHS